MLAGLIGRSSARLCSSRCSSTVSSSFTARFIRIIVSTLVHTSPTLIASTFKQLFSNRNCSQKKVLVQKAKRCWMGEKVHSRDLRNGGEEQRRRASGDAVAKGAKIRAKEDRAGREQSREGHARRSSSGEASCPTARCPAAPSSSPAPASPSPGRSQDPPPP